MARRSLDPILAADLWVFRVTASTPSFKKASEKLAVTQSAVSQRIQRLESRLGVQLFERNGRSIRLSSRGRTLFERTAEGYDCIEDALSSLQTAGQEQRLKISCVPSLALEWLTPRIQRFLSINPYIIVEVYGETHNLDRSQCIKERIDVAIRYGSRVDTNLHLAFEHRESLFPVAAPEFAKALSTQAEAAPAATLLHDASPWTGAEPSSEWDAWLGVHRPAWAATKRHVFFNLAQLAYRTAMEGGGIAMGRKLIVSRHIAAGGLVPVSEDFVLVPYNVFTVSPPEAGSAVDLFVSWLQREMQA